MTHIFSKYKSILFLTLVLVFSISAWYIFGNTKTDQVPEKAVLVLNSITDFRSIQNVY